MTDQSTGNGPQQVGKWEAWRLIHWTSLLWYILPTIGAWLAADLIPSLQASGGTAATIGGALGVLLRVVQLYLADNRAKP